MELLRTRMSQSKGLLARKKLDNPLDRQLRTQTNPGREENLTFDMSLQQARKGALHQLGGITQIRESLTLLLRSFISRSTALLSKRTLDRELDEELLAHLEPATEENVRRGMSH